MAVSTLDQEPGPGVKTPYLSVQTWGEFYLFILNFHLVSYLFLAVLGLHCCTSFSLVASSGGCSLVTMCRLLTAVVSLVEHGL